MVRALRCCEHGIEGLDVGQFEIHGQKREAISRDAVHGAALALFVQISNRPKIRLVEFSRQPAIGTEGCPSF